MPVRTVFIPSNGVAFPHVRRSSRAPCLLRTACSVSHASHNDTLTTLPVNNRAVCIRSEQLKLRLEDFRSSANSTARSASVTLCNPAVLHLSRGGAMYSGGLPDPFQFFPRHPKFLDTEMTSLLAAVPKHLHGNTVRRDFHKNVSLCSKIQLGFCVMLQPARAIPVFELGYCACLCIR